MIGIYKITNKLTNKAYIGQSIHCGKRFDEHCSGNQLIDEIIQLDGVENFNFEILKKVNKSELSVWEDYYINYYNTMFPNGYNKRWNCSEDLRKVLFNNSENIIKQSQENTIKDDDIIISEEEKEVLKESYDNMVYYGYKKEYPTDVIELKQLYKQGLLEAQKRQTIQDVCYDRSGVSISDVQKSLYEFILKIIKIFNNKKSIWRLECDKNSNNYGKLRKTIYNDSYICELKKDGIYFYLYDISIKQLQTWKCLFDKKLLNKKHIHFYLNNREIKYEDINKNNYSYIIIIIN